MSRHQMDSFQSLVGARIFVVPKNQRGFSWAQPHFKALIEDLEFAADQDPPKDHYLGTIIGQKALDPPYKTIRSGGQNIEFYTLTDGQQRLTTFFVLVNELRKKLKKLGEDVRATELENLIFYETPDGDMLPRLLNETKDLDDYYQNILTDEPSPPVDWPRPTPPMTALFNVQQAAEREFKGLNEKQAREWHGILKGSAKFNDLDLTSNDFNTYLLFDAINSRGLPLSPFDKIKNFAVLIAQSRSLSVKPDQEWYKALAELQKAGVSSRIQEGEFINDLFMVCHRKFTSVPQLHDHFTEYYRELLRGPNSAKEKEFERFVSYWASYARSFGFIVGNEKRNYKLCTAAARKSLISIDHMNLVGITRALLVPSFLVTQERKKKKEFAEIARACDIFSFRLKLFHRVDKYRKTLMELGNVVLDDSSNNCNRFAIGNLCGLLKDGNASLKEVIGELSNGRAKYYHDPDAKGWDLCYYFLYEYEDHCSGRPRNAWGWSDDQKQVTSQEHILPQKHRVKGWRNHWRNEGLADKFKHRLGNLVLTRDNSELGRKSIKKKLELYKRQGSTQSENQIKDYTDGSTWKTKNIMSRELNMMEFAVKRWQMSCSSDNGTIELGDLFSRLDDGTPKTITVNVQETKCYKPPAALAVSEDDDDQ